MIWDPSQLDEQGQSAILRRIHEACGDTSVGDSVIELDELPDVAHAVECFMQQAGMRGGESKDCLVMLTSKALSSIGKRTEARRLFLLGTSLLKMSAWEVSGSCETWTLDLKRISAVQDVPQLELVFFRALRMVLEAMADMWDETCGRGVLGLRHVSSVAAMVLGGSDDKKKVETLAAEIKATCELTLESIGVKRHWTDCPSVMNLDL